MEPLSDGGHFPGGGGLNVVSSSLSPLRFPQDPTSPSPQGLKFSIKETVCPSSQTHNLTQCDYKEDGLDQDCSAIYSTQQEQSPIVSVQCEDMDRELNRITRSRWRRFARGAGRFLRRHGPSLAFAVIG
ncbi:cathelicidin-related peptide Oh-Cath-like [Crotalus adamanteus]|uniref:Cathelicidin-related antimicrobial peptide n=1 Tax=Crotalus adamanteus TaxID=8729 RepID=A0AAW1B111_CROAD